jgi:peptide/nickel transport system permease protein
MSAEPKQVIEDAEVLDDAVRKQGQWKDIIRRLFKNKLGTIGFFLVILLIILSVFAPLFTRYDPSFQDFAARFAYPSKDHIMGCDNYGRDLWSRLLYGGRISLLVAVTSVFISNFFGIIIGAYAGYFGGKADLIITRIMDVFMAVPGLLLAIAISSALGSGPLNTAIALSISAIPHSARIMRSTVLTIKSNEFVEAAKATGSRNYRVIFKHILPNTIAPLIVNATLALGGNIMGISGLSFIGLGVQPPTPEWGSILATGRTYIRDFWPIVVFPAIFIALAVFGINLFGDALRDALDPRLKD